LRYLEDLVIGEKITTPSLNVTESDILAFATLYDPQPMHLDQDAAARGPFGGLVASGWHTVSLAMRLIVDARPFGGGPVLGLGTDAVRWPKPVRPGHAIHVEIEVLSVTPSRSKPDFGVVRIHVTARNQHGDTVLTMLPSLWVPRRRAHTGDQT
jgi:acyl dehydratase